MGGFFQEQTKLSRQ